MRKLDETIDVEKDRSASELLSSFERMSMSGAPPNLMMERERIEDHFRRLREDKLKDMMDKIATEEKARTAKMLERHGQEMMLLIAEKVSHNVDLIFTDAIFTIIVEIGNDSLAYNMKNGQL